MYDIESLPLQISSDLLALLVRAEPATIGHVLHAGFMDIGMRGLLPDRRIAGTAVTVRAPGADCTMVHYALGQVRPGDVLVIDRCGDHRHAATGGAVAYAARKAGVAGIVLDGVVSDISELRQYGVPVWARGLSTVTTKHMDLGGAFCTPISCGGVGVRPGDAILADENGVLVLGPHQIETAARTAIAMQEAEKELLARLDAGEKLPDISGATARVKAALGLV
ncbi:MAG: RraA family protein [Acetobacteraceae bacterium]|nr:RraA family protein [Acetobacteraceae bacterium]